MFRIRAVNSDTPTIKTTSKKKKRAVFHTAVQNRSSRHEAGEVKSAQSNSVPNCAPPTKGRLCNNRLEPPVTEYCRLSPMGRYTNVANSRIVGTRNR